jgi:glutathione synthase/RimK-type ligase-like ATP-grasp enzyme
VNEAGRAKVDWRTATGDNDLTWSRATLPANVADQVLKLMERLGLTYGALDFIVDPQGQHHFLEVNPAGEWGWIERDLGYGIGDALAQALVEGANA